MFLGTILDIYSNRLYLLEQAFRRRDSPVDRLLDNSVITERLDRGGRHRVDRIRADQLFDVHHVAVFRVLGARASPERALHTRSLLDERFPTGAGELLPEP